MNGVQALWGSFVEVGLHFEFWSFLRFWKEARRLLLIIEGRHYKGDETSLREQDSHASFWNFALENRDVVFHNGYFALEN